MLLKQFGRGQRLDGGNIPGARQDDIGIAIIVGRPVPDSESARAVHRGGINVHPGRTRLFACNDHVDVVTERKQWSATDSRVLASGGRYTRTTSAFLFTTWSMKPGSWCEKPLWSWRQTCEVSR